MTDEQALTRYARTGDPEAFAVVVSRYERFVFSVCVRRLVNEAESLDACQETFLRLSQHAASLHADVAAWLHKVAVNVCVDRVRSERSRLKREQAHAAMAAGSHAVSPDALAEQREALTALDGALAGLSADDHALLVSCALMDTPQCDMAERLGVSEATVSRRLQKAMGRLRTSLEQRGVVLSLAALSLLLVEVRSQAAGIVLPPQTTPFGKFSHPPVQVAATPGRVGLLQLATVAAMAVVGVGMGQVAAEGGAASGKVVAGATEKMETAVPMAATAEDEGNWQPAGLPLAWDGWWRLPADGPDAWDLVVSLDAVHGTLRFEPAFAQASGTRVLYQVLANDQGQQMLEVVEQTADPDTVGWQAPVRFERDGEGLHVSTYRVAPNAQVDRRAATQLVLVPMAKVESNRAFRATGKAASERPRFRVGISRIWIENASLEYVLRLVLNDFGNPHRSRVHGTLPAGGFDVHVEMVHSDTALANKGAWQVLTRALETELDWRVRYETVVKPAWVLRAKAGVPIGLEEVDERVARLESAGVVCEGGKRVWVAQMDSIASTMEGKLDRPLVVPNGYVLGRQSKEVLEQSPWAGKYFRFEEPWPHPSGHDPVAYFLEQSGLELVAEDQPIQVTVVEPIPEGESVSLLSAVGGWMLHRPPLPALSERLGPLKQPGVGFVSPERMVPFQGVWQVEGEALGGCLHINGSTFVFTSPSLSMYTDEEKHWPRSARNMGRFETGGGFYVRDAMLVTDMATDSQLPEGTHRIVLSDGENEGSALIRLEAGRLRLAYENDRGAGWLRRLPQESPFEAEIREVWPQVLGECPPDAKAGGVGETRGGLEGGP